MEKEGRSVKADITARKECIGIFEEIGCVTTISVSENVTLLGVETTQSETLSKDEVKVILSELLKEAGYDLNDLNFNDGIRKSTVGYFMDEHIESRAYFKGVTLNISKRGLSKTLKI